MIPILYGKSETAFTSNGLGRLTDCISCLVTEERNGIFECEFQYPVTGKLYNEMVTNGGIVSVTHDDAKDRQPFDIYKYSAPINGIVTFNARHISYRLSGIVVKPYTAASCALALNGIVTNSVSTNPFTFWTDKAVTTTFKLETPTSAKAILVGQQGSILDVYGKGEYKFDKFEVKLYTNRGTNSGVTIRYGKNLSDTLVENDSGEYYNAIVPYWKGEDGTLVKLTGWYVVQTGETLKYCIPVDFSSEFETQPTELELQTKAAAYLANNTPWLPKENVKVDFVQLWNTDEYKDVAVLERVKLCDTVAIYYPALGLTNSSAKVIKVVYDTLLERYSSIELGEPQQTLAEAIIQPYAQAIASISDKASVSFMEEAIQAATDLIAGGLGGHVVINRNADGEPEEILIMDTDDTSTAVNVWRWNLNGLAHSHSGYNGPYSDIALTMDGKINADMITTGTLNAALATIINLSANSIYGGTLTVGGLNNASGQILIKDSNNDVVGSIDNDCYMLINPSDNSTAARFGMYQNDHAYIDLYDSVYGRTVDLDGGNGSLTLFGNNGSVAAYGHNGTIILNDGTYDRVKMYGNNGTVLLQDENNVNQVFLSPASFGSLFLVPLNTYGGLFANNGLTADNATVTGVLDVTPRRCEAAVSQRGWYRVFDYNAANEARVSGDIAFLIDITILELARQSHKITLYGLLGALKFGDEVSVTNTSYVDKIRYVKNGNHGYIDIHYDSSVSREIACYYDVKCVYIDNLNRFSATTITQVADSPSGETVLTEYTFSADTITDISSSFALNTSGISGAQGKIHAIFDASSGLVHLNFSAYTTSSTFGTSTPIFTCSDSKYLPKATTNGNGMIRMNSGEWYPYEVGIGSNGDIVQFLTGTATRVYGQITYPV